MRVYMIEYIFNILLSLTWAWSFQLVSFPPKEKCEPLAYGNQTDKSLRSNIRIHDAAWLTLSTVLNGNTAQKCMVCWKLKPLITHPPEMLNLQIPAQTSLKVGQHVSQTSTLTTVFESKSCACMPLIRLMP